MENRETKSDAAPEDDQKRLMQRLGEMISQLEHMEVKSLAEYYANPRQVIFFNVVLGICRGVGFAVGASVVAAVFLSVGVKILSHFVDTPVIGKLVADIIHAMKAYESTGGAPPAPK
jgi:hypothetical protein